MRGDSPTGAHGAQGKNYSAASSERGALRDRPELAAHPRQKNDMRASTSSRINSCKVGRGRPWQPVPAQMDGPQQTTQNTRWEPPQFNNPYDRHTMRKTSVGRRPQFLPTGVPHGQQQYLGPSWKHKPTSDRKNPHTKRNHSRQRRSTSCTQEIVEGLTSSNSTQQKQKFFQKTDFGDVK